MNDNQDMAQYLKSLLQHFTSDPVFIDAKLVFAQSKQGEIVKYHKIFKGGKK